MIRYGFGVVVFMVLVGLSWRVAMVAPTNQLHLQLLKMVMQGEPGSLPESAEGVTGLAARAAAQLQPDEAQVWLESGLADYSQSLTALELCLWYWDAGQVADAAAACRESQGTTIYWIRQGIAAQLEDNQPQAIAFFEMATQIEPESAEAWFRLGVLLQLEQRYEEALVAFQQAVNHGYSAYDSLGAMYLQLGQLEEARQVLLEGVSVYPDARYTYLYLAQVAEAEEGWVEANSWYAQLAVVSPDYGPAYSGRGRIAVRLGEYDQAVA
jgi:tetratricopeptide (TPR) repeat protein